VNEFRNLLHLNIFYRKASDEEARAWHDRKTLVAQGLTNQISVEKEALELQTQKDAEMI